MRHIHFIWLVSVVLASINGGQVKLIADYDELTGFVSLLRLENPDGCTVGIIGAGRVSQTTTQEKSVTWAAVGNRQFRLDIDDPKSDFGIWVKRPNT